MPSAEFPNRSSIPLPRTPLEQPNRILANLGRFEQRQPPPGSVPTKLEKPVK